MTPDDLKELMLFHCMDAPAWANWGAIDKDGSLYVYSSRPHMDFNRYWHGDAKCNDMRLSAIKLGDIDWKETLVGFK